MGLPPSSRTVLRPSCRTRLPGWANLTARSTEIFFLGRSGTVDWVDDSNVSPAQLLVPTRVRSATATRTRRRTNSPCFFQ